MAVDSIGFINPETNQLRSKKELEALDKKAAEAKVQEKSQEQSNTEDTSAANALTAVRARTSQQVNSVVSQLDRRKATLDSSKENLQDLRSVARDLKEAIKSGDDAKADKLRQDFAALQAQREKLAKQVDEENAQQRVDGPTLVKVGNKVKASFKFDDIKVKKGDPVDTETTEGLNKFLDDSDQDLAAVKEQIHSDKDVRKQVRQVNRDTRGDINSIASKSDEQASKQISSLTEAGLVAQGVADAVRQNPDQSLVSQVDSSQAEKLLSAL